MRRLATIALLVAVDAGPASAGDAPLPLDVLLEQPISTAAKYEQQLSHVAASVTVITAEEIERYGWRTVEEALESVRGLYTTDDRNYSYLGIRGVGRPTDYNQRLLVLVDGLAINGPVFGGAPLGTALALDIATVDRIEVVRGPSSAVYGDHAILGVVQIITRGADAIDGVESDVALASHGGRAGTIRFGRTLGNAVALAASAYVETKDGDDLYYAEYDEPGTNFGVAEGLDYDDRYGAHVQIERRAWTLDLAARERTKGIPNASYETRFNADSHTIDAVQSARLRYQRPLGAGQALEVIGSWQGFRSRAYYVYDEVGVEDTRGARWNGEVRWQWDPRPNQRLTIGAELAETNRASYDYVIGDFAVHLHRPYSGRSLYLQHEAHPTRWLGLVAGVRHDDFSHTSAATTPRLAVLLAPSRATTVKLLYGSAFRTPNVYELHYADDLTPWRANPDLQDETVRTAELVWEQRVSPALFVVGSVFDIRAHSLIEQQQDPLDGIYSYQNLGRLRSRGAELSAEWRRASGLWAHANYAYQEATADGEPLSNAPRHLLKAGLSTSPWARWHGGLQAVLEDGRRTRDATDLGTQLVLHGSASRALGPRLRLSLAVRNLLDRELLSPVGPELRPQAIELDGRTFTLKLRVMR